MEITVDETVVVGEVVAAVYNGLAQYGPPGEHRVALISSVLMAEGIIFRSPEGRREAS